MTTSLASTSDSLAVIRYLQVKNRTVGKEWVVNVDVPKKSLFKEYVLGV